MLEFNGIGGNMKVISKRSEDLNLRIYKSFDKDFSRSLAKDELSGKIRADILGMFADCIAEGGSIKSFLRDINNYHLLSEHEFIRQNAIKLGRHQLELFDRGMGSNLH